MKTQKTQKAKAFTKESISTELFDDDQQKRFGKRKGLFVMDGITPQFGDATEIKSSEEIFVKGDFPEGNKCQKKTAKALQNPKNSTLTTSNSQNKKNFLGKKTLLEEKEKNQTKTKESKTSKKNFSIANKGHNITNDKSNQIKEKDYSKKENDEIIFPDVVGIDEYDLIDFCKYKAELLNKIIEQYGLPSQLSRPKIKYLTLLYESHFEKLNKIKLSDLFFSADNEENNEVIESVLEEEKRIGKSGFKFLMNLTFAEGFDNYKKKCNVYCNKNNIYIFEL